MVVIYNFTSYLHTLIFFNGKKNYFLFHIAGSGRGRKKVGGRQCRRGECAVVVFSASYVSLKTKRLVCDSFPLPGFLSGPGLWVSQENGFVPRVWDTRPCWSLLVPVERSSRWAARVPSPGPAGGSLRTGPT